MDVYEVIINCVLIILARICDVSFSTLRTVNLVQGNRGRAFTFGFLEVFIWVNVVSRVISKLNNPIYGVSYALGFALGNYIGLVLEEKIAWGEQVARVFTRDRDLEHKLRDLGFGVTVFEGRGKDGAIQELFVQASRRSMKKVIEVSRRSDPGCYYLVGNVSYTSDRRNDT